MRSARPSPVSVGQAGKSEYLIAATGFSILAAALMVLGAAWAIASDGAAAQDPLEVYSDPPNFAAILANAEPSLRLVLLLDGLFAFSYAGAVGFAALGFRGNCVPAAWASGIGIIATMLLDIGENLLMLGSLELAHAGQGITNDRVSLHVFTSGLKLHAAAFALIAFSFVLPSGGIVTFLMRWGSRTLMPAAALLFVTGAFGLRGEASLGVFFAMTGGLGLQAFLAFRESSR